MYLIVGEENHSMMPCRKETSVSKPCCENTVHSVLESRLTNRHEIWWTPLDMIERIGSGAFGEIYKCRWRGILVAAKCIKASKIQKEWILKRNLDKSSDRVANRIEAIKQASITEDDKQLALEDFRRETAIMRRLRHVSNDGF
jgi:serine/threonine protein kinase